MKVLTICYEYPPLGGGGAPVCEGLCESLVNKGHHVDVVTSLAADLPAEERRNGVTIYRTCCLRRHLHYTTAFELLTGILPALQKAVERFRYLWKRIVNTSRSIVTPTSYLATLLNNYREKQQLEIIPNGIYLPENSPVRPGNRILMVSRIFQRKGVDILLQAFADLDTDWELVIAGDGPFLETAKNLAAELGIAVQFLGHVDKAQLPALYQSARIFVLPSSHENFPVVLLEALAAGCAIISTSGSGCPEVVGEAGILVEPGSPQALSRALAGLLADEQRLETLRHESLQRIEKFSWQNVAARYEAHYQRVLEQSR